MKGISKAMSKDVADVLRLTDFPNEVEKSPPPPRREDKKRSYGNQRDRTQSRIEFRPPSLNRAPRPSTQNDKSPSTQNDKSPSAQNDRSYRNQVKERVPMTRVQSGEDYDTIRLSSIIRNYGIKHSLPEAVKHFEEAKELQPDRIGVYTYTAMLSACVRSKDMALAQKYFKEMQGKGISPNIVTYNTLIAGYNRTKEYDKAWELFQELKSKGLSPDEITFSYILVHQADTKDEERKRLIDAELKSNQAVNPTQGLKNNLVRAASLGNVNDAFNWLYKIKDAGIPLDWFLAKQVLKACATSGNYRRVPEIYELVSKGSKIRLQTYESNILIQGFIVKGNMDMAEKIFHEMLEVGNSRNDHTYNALVHGWAKQGRPEKVRLSPPSPPSPPLPSPLSLTPPSLSSLSSFLLRIGLGISAGLYTTFIVLIQAKIPSLPSPPLPSSLIEFL